MKRCGEWPQSALPAACPLPCSSTSSRPHNNTIPHSRMCDAQQRPQQVWGMQYPKAPCCRQLASPWVGHTQARHCMAGHPGLSHVPTTPPQQTSCCSLLPTLVMTAACWQASKRVEARSHGLPPAVCHGPPTNVPSGRRCCCQQRVTTPTNAAHTAVNSSRTFIPQQCPQVSLQS
jgi:hypothetical protein